MSENIKKHTYCFYMTNGEHLMFDADILKDEGHCFMLYRNDVKEPFICVYKQDLMAWEAVR